MASPPSDNRRPPRPPGDMRARAALLICNLAHPGCHADSLLLINFGLFLVQKFWSPAWIGTLALSHWAPQWWQFVTASFLHANWEHLSSNAFSLLIFGRIGGPPGLGTLKLLPSSQWAQGGECMPAEARGRLHYQYATMQHGPASPSCCVLPCSGGGGGLVRRVGHLPRMRHWCAAAQRRPARVLQGEANAVQRHGCRISEHVRVTGLVRQAGHIKCCTCCCRGMRGVLPGLPTYSYRLARRLRCGVWALYGEPHTRSWLITNTWGPGSMHVLLRCMPAMRSTRACLNAAPSASCTALQFQNRASKTTRCVGPPAGGGADQVQALATPAAGGGDPGAVCGQASAQCEQSR